MMRVFWRKGGTVGIVLGTLFFSIFALNLGLQWFNNPFFSSGTVFSLVAIYFLVTHKKAKEIDGSWFSVVIAALHVFFPLLYVRNPSNPFLEGNLLTTVALIALLGLSIAVASIIDLSGSLGILPAHRGIKKTGLYREVRHPIYLGYIIMHIGVVLAFWHWINGILFLAYLVLVHLRIVQEERLLSRYSDYVEYKGRVSSRIIPRLY